MPVAGPLDAPELGPGLAELRAGRFFEAHEEWERVWRSAGGDERRLLQGLIQLAAAFVHVGASRPGPARRLLVAAADKLEGLPTPVLGIDPSSLRARLLPLAASVGKGRGTPLPSLPELGFSGRPGPAEA